MITATEFGPIENPEGLDLSTNSPAWRALEQSWCLAYGVVPTKIVTWMGDFEVHSRKVWKR